VAPSSHVFGNHSFSRAHQYIGLILDAYGEKYQMVCGKNYFVKFNLVGYAACAAI
jgi:hypothetical protein